MGGGCEAAGAYGFSGVCMQSSGWDDVLTSLRPARPRAAYRGKPLREVDAERTGRRWRHPSPSTHIKAAALRTLCQALVPDSSRFRPSAAQTERARLVWEALEPLADPDPHSEQFARFDFVCVHGVAWQPGCGLHCGAGMHGVAAMTPIGPHQLPPPASFHPQLPAQR